MPEHMGRIFNIQKFSIHDGPGIRTVVFLKGCPLACRWCSNPGSRKLQVLKVRDIDDADAFVEDSRDYSIREVVDVCLQDRPFYEESGGGVTLSGGEALVQHGFALELLDALRVEGIHTAIETTGYVAPGIFEEALARLDLVLIDVKHHDAGRHQEWTGRSNELPYENLRRCVAHGGEFLARIPVIPGVNDGLDDAAAFARRLLDAGVDRVQLLPFHQFGERKYELLGWEYEMAGVPALHREELEPFRQVMVEAGVAAFC